MYIFDLKKSNVLDFSFSLSEGLCVTKDSEQKKTAFLFFALGRELPDQTGQNCFRNSVLTVFLTWKLFYFA